MRHATSITALCALVLVLASGLSAQVTFAGKGPLFGATDMSYLPTAAHPGGASPLPVPPLPNASLLPPVSTVGLFGGMTCDQRNAWIYTTDGFQMAMDMDPNFLVFGLTPPPPFAGTLPIPLPAGLGPISGLGYDDAGGILWACDGGTFFGLNPLPPFNIIVPPLPIPGVGIPITGLDYDPCDLTLWACDAQGGIYHFTPAGLPIGPQPVNIVPTLTLLGGLAVATHNGAGALAPPACSTQIPGYHVTVNDGSFIHDALGAAPSLPLAGFGVPYGLAYSPDYQVLSCAPAGTPGASCSSGFVPFAGLREPFITGPGVFNAIQLTNAPPTTPAILILDLCPLLPCWNGLMMNPFSWTTLGTTTTAAGTASFGFFAGGFPKGFQFSFQWAVQDAGAPLGWCFSNVSTQTVGAP
ncbi:MAG: hypothetical protein R3F20_15630 [Planctomycetota bacterium]